MSTELVAPIGASSVRARDRTRQPAPCTPVDVAVRGGASAEEVAAVIAALSARVDEPQPSNYERWRMTRLDAWQRLDAHPTAPSWRR